MNTSKLITLALAGMMLVITFGASASDAPPQAKTTIVTDENYSLAETDGIMEGYVKKIAAATNTNGVGVLMHYRRFPQISGGGTELSATARFLMVNKGE